jgi:hypothetical protein
MGTLGNRVTTTVNISHFFCEIFTGQKPIEAVIIMERVAQRELLNLNRVEKFSLFPVLLGV